MLESACDHCTAPLGQPFSRSGSAAAALSAAAYVMPVANRFVLSRGPGGGKSALLAALAERGYP